MWTVLNDARNLYKAPSAVIPPANTGDPGVPFNSDTLKGGMVKKRPRGMPSFGVVLTKANAVGPTLNRQDYFQDPQVLIEQRGILRWRLSGVTRDHNGTAIPSCSVILYYMPDRILIEEFVSSAVDGSWSKDVQAGPYWLIAYKSTNPDVGGMTVKTLTGEPEMPFP